MNILVIGGTGRVGSLVVDELVRHRASVRVLTTDPSRCDLPPGVAPVKGDLLDPATLRKALEGIETMFLLAAVSPSELTQSLLALDVAHELGVEHVVYFSQIKLDWPDCPHAVAKSGAEALIRAYGMQATVLRPSYFFQNDAALKEPILGGTYPIPIGSIGAEMVDVRDIAAAAAVAIVDKKEIGTDPVLELVGPENITGVGAAEIWSEVTGRLVTYGGDALGPTFENKQTQVMPAWQAHDLTAMFRGCQREGMRGQQGAAERLQKLIGHPLRSYRSFAEETYEQWQST